MKKLVLLLASLMIVACASPKPAQTQSMPQDSNSFKNTDASSGTMPTTTAPSLTASNGETSAIAVDKTQNTNPDAGKTAQKEQEYTKASEKDKSHTLLYYILGGAFAVMQLLVLVGL